MEQTSEIYPKVADIIATTLGIDKKTITPTVTFEHLGVDSLDMLEIVMKIEEAFVIEVDDERAAQLKTVQEAVTEIEKLVNKKK